MSNAFSQFDLPSELLQTVSDRGYTTPTPIQEALIPAMLAGRDVIGQAQTGTGKTAAFALPIIQGLEPDSDTVQALVLTPTRELAKQVAEAAYTYGSGLNTRVLPIYGGQSYSRQTRRLRKGVDVVVATPGRLLDLIRKKSLDLSEVKVAVLDEADEMLSMGFIDDIESILKATPGDRQTAFFSATLPRGIQRLADRHMRNPETCRIEPDQRTAGTIEQRYYQVKKKDRLDALLRLLEAEPTESVIVFARTRADTFELAESLRKHGCDAGAINGAMEQPARNRMLSRFRSRQIDVLVGTNVAARGLDINHISHVFNYELPRDPQVYVHRVGRTGRAGRKGTAISLISSRQRKQLHKIERYAKCDISRSNLPTRAEVQAIRDERMAEKMSEQVKESEYARERDIAASLVEQGLNPIDVAAAAMKALRNGKESASSSASGSASARSQPGGRSRSDDRGMVRLTLDTGKASGTRPKHVVSSLAHFGNIPGGVIGKIRIRQRHTLVDVPGKYVDQVVARSGHYKICNQNVKVQRA